MADRTCEFKGCLNPYSAKGWCVKHYTRWRKHGDPAIVAKTGVKPGPVKECLLDDCHNPVNSHGLCGKHDQRRRKTGDPLTQPNIIIGDDEARFWSKVDVRGPDECWPWKASLFQDGYGQFSADGQVCGAHRWAYEHCVETIPDGLQIDHLCHTRERLTCIGGKRCQHRRCVNPAHLEPVPQKINAERGIHAGEKVTPEQVVALHARHVAGESVIALALEAGVKRGALYKRFRRIEQSAA